MRSKETSTNRTTNCSLTARQQHKNENSTTNAYHFDDFLDVLDVGVERGEVCGRDGVVVGCLLRRRRLYAWKAEKQRERSNDSVFARRTCIAKPKETARVGIEGANYG